MSAPVEADDNVRWLREQAELHDYPIGAEQSRYTAIADELERSRTEIAGERSRHDDTLGVLAEARSQLATATDKLADYEASYRKSIESPCPDEQHCACVPDLRTEVARLDALAAGMFWAGAGGFDDLTEREVVALGLNIRAQLAAATEQCATLKALCSAPAMPADHQKLDLYGDCKCSVCRPAVKNSEGEG